MNRYCEACGAPLVRKPHEARKNYLFRKRRTCGKSCALKLRRRPASDLRSRYRYTKVNGRSRLLSRALVERAMGRSLARNEHVHHKNHDSKDDRLDNYEVLTPSEHAAHHKSKHPREKTCSICQAQFVPHPTKRQRQQTCSWDCRNALIAVNRHGVPLATARTRVGK